MANENVQGAIPLAGRGYQFKRGGNYAPGEYPELVNAEIALDESLVPRRNIVAPQNSTVIPNGYRILGAARDVVIMQSATVGATSELRLMTADGVNDVCPNWTQAKLLNTATYPDVLSHEVLGVTWYNNKVVWVSATVINVTGGYRKEQLWIHQNGQLDPFAIPNAFYYDHDLASHTKVWEGLTSLPSEVANPQTVKAFFIHKNRLWIQTPKTLFFSEVGNPNNFSATGGKGGFINMNDYLATHAVAVGNDIYVSGNSVVERISYTTDPNSVTDVSVVRVSANLGANQLAIYENQVYFVANDSLYSINGNTLSKIVELNINRTVGGFASPFVDIYSWSNYLIFRSYYDYPMDTRTHYQTWRRAKSPSVTKAPHITFLNMDNGAMHQVHYVDQFPTGSDAPTTEEYMFGEDNAIVGTYARGVVIDILPVGSTDHSNNSWLWFLSQKSIGFNVNGYIFDTTCRASIMKNDEREAGTGTSNSFQTAPTYFDILFSDGNVQNVVCPYTAIEIQSFAPDGSEYLMKKFRNLMIEADWPTRYYQMYIAFGKAAYSLTGLSFTAPETADDSKDRNPEAQRFGLNQRARSISIKIRTRRRYLGPDPLNGDLTSYKATYFNITDIRTLWTYTARVPLGRIKDKS